MKEFDLNGKEFIELNKLLKLLRAVNSGGEANIAIESKEVTVNNNIETQKRKKLRSGDLVKFQDLQIKIL
jgi:ribosome-associated protein